MATEADQKAAVSGAFSHLMIAEERRYAALALACDSVKSGVSTDVVRTAREFLGFLEGDRDAG